jgi:uncharacterized integral membrane protein (TIGR00697 family)
VRVGDRDLKAGRAEPRRSPTIATTAGVVVIAAYVSAQMLSDVLSLKIALVGLFSVDVGTFVYPLTFTLRDLVHKLLGRSAARTTVAAAGIINLVMAASFAFAAWLPPDPTWPLQHEFAAVLSPVWRIVVASIAAELVSELIDTEIYHLWVTHVTRRFQWARVLASNAVSVPLDSMIFCWGAFAGTLPEATVWSIFWANVLMKGAVTAISLPGIYLVREHQE